jgi:hypothetical protein
LAAAGRLDEAIVNEIVVFIGTAEARSSKPFNRFADMSALDAVDLNFKFVFDVALHRRLAYAGNPAVKSAFYVTSPTTVHYSKLHKLLNDYSAINVRLFTELAEAAKWLDVPMKVLTMHF